MQGEDLEMKLSQNNLFKFVSNMHECECDRDKEREREKERERKKRKERVHPKNI